MIMRQRSFRNEVQKNKMIHMLDLYRYFRGAITTIFLAVVATIIAEFFLVPLRPSGIFEHPFDLLAAAIKYVIAIPDIWYFAALTGGLTTGMWLDTIVRRTATKTKSETKREEKSDNRTWVTGTHIIELADAGIVWKIRQSRNKLSILNSELDDIQVIINHRKPQDSYQAIKQMSEGKEPKELVAARERQKEIVRQFNLERNVGLNLFNMAVQDIHAKLRNRTLIAKGFLTPIQKDSEFQEIIASRWNFLRLIEPEFQKASGEGIEYTGIAMAKN
jgi:hypothetical protein